MDADCLMWLLWYCTAVPITQSPAPQPCSRAASDVHSPNIWCWSKSWKAWPVWGQSQPPALALLAWGWGPGWVGDGTTPHPIITHNPLPCDSSLCSLLKASHTAPPQIPSFSNSNSASSVTNYLRNGVAIREQILAAPPSMVLLDLGLSTSFSVRVWVLPRVCKGIFDGITGSQPTSQLCGWWHILNVLNEYCNIRSVIISVQ